MFVSVYRLIKEMYLIVPHVERLVDIRKSLQQTIHDACTVRTISLICYVYGDSNKTVNQKFI